MSLTVRALKRAGIKLTRNVPSEGRHLIQTWDDFLESLSVVQDDLQAKMDDQHDRIEKQGDRINDLMEENNNLKTELFKAGLTKRSREMELTAGDQAFLLTGSRDVPEDEPAMAHG